MYIYKQYIYIEREREREEEKIVYKEQNQTRHAYVYNIIYTLHIIMYLLLQ